MAYTSVIPVHRLDRSTDYVLDPKKTSRSQNPSADSLQEAVDYALNRDKTEQDLFEDALGCTCATAYEDMKATKERWHKQGGVEGYHLVQSFVAGEATPELAHRIGREFAERLLGGRYEAVLSTHLNTAHLHNHLVWNSVSLIDGKKYHSNAKSYYKDIRRLSDELCQKYGLSVIHTKKAEQGSRPYAEWMTEKDGQLTWRSGIRADVDEAISLVFTWKQFLSELERRGYELNLDRKYPTLRPPGKERPVRFKTLGVRYTPEAIQERILNPKTRRPPAGKESGRQAARRYRLVTHGHPVRRRSGLRALYYVYLFRMGVLKRKPRRRSYLLRQDIYKLDVRLEQMRYINRHHIDNREQLAARRCAAEAKIAELTKERQQLYRSHPNAPRIQELNAALKPLRKEVRMCRAIEQHSIEMEAQMRKDREAVQREQEERNIRTKDERRR